jgi:predicted SprT family Zn-dependent metalloprotease
MEKPLPTTVRHSFFLAQVRDPESHYNLPELFKEFNRLYFDGGLPPTKIKWEGRYSRVWGKYLANGEIRIGRNCARAEDPAQVKSTLLHEMLHRFLDVTNQDDGVLGHGPNFIDHAVAINKMAEANGARYRINFYDVAVTREEPVFYCDLLKTEIKTCRDLDTVRRMKSLVKAAFDSTVQYQQ